MEMEAKVYLKHDMSARKHSPRQSTEPAYKHPSTTFFRLGGASVLLMMLLLSLHANNAQAGNSLQATQSITATAVGTPKTCAESETISHGKLIGASDVAKLLTEFKVPTPNDALGGITAGPDGAIWFGETTSNLIGRLTTDGKFSEY